MLTYYSAAACRCLPGLHGIVAAAALQLVHRAALVRLGEARIALACQQHEQEAAEAARLRAEIAARAAARQQQGAVAAPAGSEGGAPTT
jgi:hypothetical protein